MIENAVASTLMRLPVSELSALRKVFLACPSGLSLEGFVAAMLPSACNDTSAIKRNSQPQQLQRKGSSSSRRLSTQKARSTTLARRRSSSFAANAAERSDVLGEAVVSAEGGRRIRNTRRKQSVSRARRRSSTTNGNPSNSKEGPATPALEMRRSKRRVKRFERGGGSGGGVVNNAVDQLAWAEREGGGAGWSLSEEERIGVVTDLVELFQQVDHNGDQVMEWEEFTGFVIDQVLALTREDPIADRLRARSLGARDKPSTLRSSVRRVRYDKNLVCVFSCAGPVVEVWDPAMRCAPGAAGVSSRQRDGSCCSISSNNITKSSSSSSSENVPTKGLFAYAFSEETRGFEIGTSAALPSPEAEESTSKTNSSSGGGGGSGNGNRRSLHGANPNKNRDGAPVNVIALDVKYIEASKLLVVLRSDLTLAFFLAENNFLRVGLAKTTSQQYVLEHCPVTGVVFTSGCDGTILLFAIETTTSSDSEQPQYILATAAPIGALRRHTDVVQDLLAVNGSEAEGGQRLVSCGLDRRVCVWDIVKGTFVQSKHGNRAAIRSLAFDPRDNLLLGAGVEGEVLAWDMWSRLGAPLLRLQGHRSPIVSVACAPGKGRAASLDDSGKMILWDTRRNAVVDNNERYLCQVDCSSNRPTCLDMVCDDTDEYRRWSHIGVSVVTSGRYMKIYDAVDPREANPPIAAALYSQICVSFVTCNGPFVTLWDACTGRAVRTDRAMEGDIMRACLDGGERRLILASSLGEIVVFGYLQGTRIRSLSPGHDGPVSGLAYVKEDKVIVTGGWDRSLRVYDEVPREGDPPLLRQVEGAHSSDINVVSASQRLSLIASGSAGGSCRLWDFQFLSCEGSYSIGNGALCMRFLEPHPLVAVGDAGGYVSIVPVRPWSSPGWDGTSGRCCSVLLRFANDQEAEGTIEGPAAVTYLTYSCGVGGAGGGAGDASGCGGGASGCGGRSDVRGDVDGGSIGSGSSSSGVENLVLYTGDDTGTVRAWNVGDFLASVLECHEVQENDLPRSKRNYDPRRRFNRQHAETPVAGSAEVDRGSSGACDTDSSMLSSENGGEMGEGLGVLQDSDGATVQQQRASLGGGGITQGGGMGNTAAGIKMGVGGGKPTRPGIFDDGVVLIGQWTPHSEAVVSLEVLQDPPCLLTASRDRSVKLRALSTNDHQPTGDIPNAPERATTGQEEQMTEAYSNERNKINNGDDPKASNLRPPLSQKPQEQEPISAADEPPKARRRNGSSSESYVSMSSSNSPKSATSTKVPVLGYDLCTLTLGRIADGFRRDTYSFPVDLKGRGEGRAVEARAILQAIEEIEARKEKRKRDEAALARARGGAAAAAAATTAAALLPPPSAPRPSATATATTTVELCCSSDAPPPLPSNTGEKCRKSEGNPGDAAEPEPPSCTTSQQQHVPVAGPAPRLLFKPPASVTGGGGVPPVPASRGMHRVSSAAALHKAITTFGVKTTASASKLVEQCTPSPSSRAPPALQGTKNKDVAGSGGNSDNDIVNSNSDNNNNNNSSNNNRGHAMYENMAVEELRLKNLEASSKMAVRCAREALTMKALLEPTPFLLSQMPDALSSYPAITTIFTKHGGVIARPETLSNHTRARGHLALTSKRRSAVGRNKCGSSSSSCPSLHLSSTGGSRLSCSFDRPPCQEQPSLLDYSKKLKVGTGSGTVLSGGAVVARSTGGVYGNNSSAVGGLPPSEGSEETATVAAAAAATTRSRVRVCGDEGLVLGDDAQNDNFVSGTDDDADDNDYAGKMKSTAITCTAHDKSRQKGEGIPEARQRVNTSLTDNDGGSKFSEVRRNGNERGGFQHQQQGERESGRVGGADGMTRPEGIVAKVKTRRSPRRKLPGYLSASPDGFGAASRWGALSSAHLEFYRLNTAGILSSLSCPSLQHHFEEAASSVHRTFCNHVRAPGAAGMTRLRASSRGRQDPSPPYDKPLVPADLDAMAQRHERAQAQWKQRLEVFAAETSTAASGVETPGKSRSTRSKKVRKGSSPRRPLQSLAVPQRHGGVSVTGKAGKRSLPPAKGKRDNGGWSYVSSTAAGVRQMGAVREAGGAESVAQKEELLRSKTKFGPYARNEMFELWRALNRATAYGRKVDARVLLESPLLRDDSRYCRRLIEEAVLSAANITAPVLLTREDALVKLLPKLDRVEARTFIAVAKRAKADQRIAGEAGKGVEAVDGDGDGDGDGDCDDDGNDKVDMDQELRELRNLFDLYDVDRSGLVDVKEIVAALKGNYSSAQISAGMGDAVTEAELAALLSSLSPDGAGTPPSTTTAGDAGTTGAKRNDVEKDPEVDFDRFVHLFRGVF